MFTGLIEEIGKVRSVSESKGTRRMVIAASRVTPELRTGESVSVSGVCLTALDIQPDSFAADLAAETVARTSLSRLTAGSLVNLELPTKAGARLGGHIVQGHVDGTGKLVSLLNIADGEDWQLEVDIPNEITKYVVFKGSIAIEGISFTVAKIEGTRVRVAVIPHTYEATNLSVLKPGSLINIEADVLAKYAEKMLRGEDVPSNVTIERLLSEGF